MPRMTKCFLDGKEISVHGALKLRDESRQRKRRVPDFVCDKCAKAVRPHKAGGEAAAHFEHLSRNPNCPQSDPVRE
jgi:hypothetical protein